LVDAGRDAVAAHLRSRNLAESPATAGG